MNVHVVHSLDMALFGQLLAVAALIGLVILIVRGASR